MAESGGKLGRTIRVGLLKAVPEPWEVERNWETVERLSAPLEGAGLDLLITPECFLDGYVTAQEDWTPERFAAILQDEAGPYIPRAQALARRLGCWLILGLTERRGTGGSNTALLIDRRGAIAGRYDKTHLLDHDVRYVPGAALPVFETDWGRLGIVICADRRWPETVRALAIQGAQLVAIPSYGMWHEANEWWMRTRAYENGLFVAFAHPRVAFIADPKGNLRAKLLSSVSGVLVEDLPLGEVDRRMLDHRRPELYGVLEGKGLTNG
jgi:predicted amidohydrolase